MTAMAMFQPIKGIMGVNLGMPYRITPCDISDAFLLPAFKGVEGKNVDLTLAKITFVVSIVWSNIE